MNVEKLDKVFKEIKNTVGLDYATTKADDWGDCSTDVQYELSCAYGKDSKGIYTKHWCDGMNAGPLISELDEVVIGHDLTPEQGEEVLRILKRNYTLKSEEYNPLACFIISEKEKMI